MGIAFLYGSFFLFILSLVVFASFQDFHMVEENYYDKEIAYQQHIDKVSRTRQLSERLSIELDQTSGLIQIQFPTFIDPATISGDILFFRPSNAAMDRKITIDIDSNSLQEISPTGLEKGRWKLMIYWQVDTVEYFDQQEIYLQ